MEFIHEIEVLIAALEAEKLDNENFKKEESEL